MPTRIRRGLRTVSLFSLPLVFVLIWMFWPQQAYLSPDLIPPPGTYDVEILRDTWGVPHVFGQTDADVAYGLAYAHAEDDFRTIQETLAAGRGMLASIYGLDSAPVDYMVGLLRNWDVVNEGYENGLSPQARTLHEAYADGLNHYAVLHPDQVLSPDLFPLSGKDIVAGAVLKSPLFFGLDDTLAELFADERQSALSPRPQAFAVDTRYGSNVFAVAPGRSAGGSTFLAVNSHQPWTGPVAWYEAHVHSEAGWDMVGGTFPGSPVIIHGHNRRLGWAFTVNHPDLADVYVLDTNPEDPNQYRFDGQWRDLEVRQVPITVRLFGRVRITVEQEALWSVYGPVVRRPHGTYALRFAGYGRVDVFEQLYRMNRAQSFAQWQDAMRDSALPNFNVGYADADGTIFYLYNGKLPLRASGYDWSLYLPGDTSDTLWRDYLPFARLPQVLNPPSGFVQNANSTPFHATLEPYNPDPANYDPSFGIETYQTNRALRALSLFGDDDAITFDEFVAYKYDVAYDPDSFMAKAIRRLAAEPLPEDARLRAAITRLRGWDLRTGVTNDRAALAVLMLHFLGDINEEFSLSASEKVEVPIADLWQSLDKAAAHLIEHFGRLDVPWGEVQRLRRGDMDLPLGGGPDVLHAAYGSLAEDGRLVANSGDSYVLLARWYPDGGVESYSIHQFGSATLDPASPHYADQAPLFARRQLKPVWMDEREIRAHLEAAYRPGEEPAH